MMYNQRCKIRRELLGLTAGDIAAKAKVSISTVSRFESGADDMTEIVINGLRTIYDKLPDDLGLDSMEKRYLRIAEDAVCVFNEKKAGFRVKYCSQIVINAGHAIAEETKPKDLPKERTAGYGRKTGKVYIG